MNTQPTNSASLCAALHISIVGQAHACDTEVHGLPQEAHVQLLLSKGRVIVPRDAAAPEALLPAQGPLQDPAGRQGGCPAAQEVFFSNGLLHLQLPHPCLQVLDLMLVFLVVNLPQSAHGTG
jgi:hypothetical protein